MRNLLLLALCAGALEGATLRGVVLENQTGKPLQRAVVAVRPVPGSAGASLAVRTNIYGSFEFPAMPAGSYLLSAARPGFVTLQYGQKDWRSSGTPVVLEETTNAVIDMRLKRYGAIGGAILDENDVGIPEYNVVAYRNTRPPTLIGKAITDDRGIYRIPELEPGSYLVRSAAKAFADESYLPTFARQSARVEEAYAIDVRLDEQADATNVKPQVGRLLEIAGRVYAGPYQDTPPTTVTLVSDMGRETVTTTLDFKFNPVAPGPFELFAECASDRRFGVLNGYMPISMERDRTDIRLGLTVLRETSFYFQDSGGRTVNTDGGVEVLARRKDLAGIGPVQTIKFQRIGQKLLAAGRWELALSPLAGYYVSAFSGPGYEKTAASRPDGWNEIVVGQNGAVVFTLTPGPGSLTGTVVTAEHQPAVSAPVFLEAYDPDARRRVKDVATTRADIRGAYRFTGLAPGVYRVMSTFDYQLPDEPEMERAQPKVVKIEAGRAMTQDLDLYAAQ